MFGFLLVPRSEAGGAVVAGAFMEGAGPEGVYKRRAVGRLRGPGAPPPNNQLRRPAAMHPLSPDWLMMP